MVRARQREQVPSPGPMYRVQGNRPRRGTLTSGPTGIEWRDAGVMSTQRRVLVVDDNVDSAEILADLLRIKGFEVSVAHSPTAALELMATFSPEVALLDIGLTGMTGYELGRRIRQTAATCRLIAVTGHADLAARARSLDEGFAAHLVKPVSMGQVLRALTDAP